MNFNSKQIPPPKYWQEFKDLCLAVFKRVWSDPTATKNGRSGQQQHGTDISGKPRDSKGFHGVQCKDKDTILGSEVTKAEFDAEIAKAENFKPALAHWILANTAPKDAKMEEHARERSTERERDGKFGVQILFWEDLQSLIASHPDVIEEFFPDQSPRTLRLMERLEGKATPEAVAKARKKRRPRRPPPPPRVVVRLCGRSPPPAKQTEPEEGAPQKHQRSGLRDTVRKILAARYWCTRRSGGRS
jgi:hypothetical protein